MINEINIPHVPQSKIDAETVARVNGFIRTLSVRDNLEAARKGLESEVGLSVTTQLWYASKLRKMFHVPARKSLSEIATHPQLRQAVEYLLVRKERSDALSLTSAKGLSVIVPTTGEQISVEAFLKSLYPREGVNASSCYVTLKACVIKKRIVHDDMSPATMEELPSERTVRAFLKRWRDEYVAVRRGRSRKHDFETQEQAYVSRNVDEYRPGQLWIADHTELDFIVLNEEGKPDRRWISAFIDIRTGLLVGYHLSWQPNSQTISLAFRSGVLGSQLRAFTGDKFEPVSITNIPESVMMDNGKDYRSKYTQRVFGKVDFDDAARLSVQRVTSLNYTLPYHGQSKAQMERWFGTIQTMLKYLPGYKGNKYQNKPDSLKDDIKAGAILTVEQFDALVATGINTYNNRIRRTLKDQTPLQYYLTNQTHQRSIDQRVLDFLMMKVQGRAIRRCQVTLMGQDYYSDSLMRFNGQNADVYYDPNDLGFISIYVNGEFAAVASNKEMIGRSERGWQRIVKDRSHSEKSMRHQLMEFKQGISDRDARALLIEGQLLNMQGVPADLLRANSPNVAIITGLESQAKENLVEVEREKRNTDAREKRKKADTILSFASAVDKLQ